MTALLVTDLGVSRELLRHRAGSFVQESDGHCNYDEDQFGREIAVVKPSTWESWSDSQREWWEDSLKYAELNYLYMSQDDLEPEQARSVLPNSLKTELVVRASFREWRSIFRMRAIDKTANPDMRALLLPFYERCRRILPCCFDDLGDPQ
jgi:thymidylate synthase (FAD)